MYPTKYYKLLDSTNIKAKELAENGAISGTAVVSEDQSKGRGRLGKDWCSVPGKGLYCSIIVRPDLELSDYPKITLIAGLAVAKVLDSMSGKLFQLKWPNDIYLGGKKIAGILTEASSLPGTKSARYAVVGIGVNVNQQEEDFPSELQRIVTSLAMETASEYQVETIFQKIRSELLIQLKRLELYGFVPLLSEWRERDFLKGKEMQCVNSKGQNIQGTGQGIDEQGRLYVKDGRGQLHEVLSGDVSLALTKP